MSAAPRTIRKSALYPRSPQDVWPALTDSHALAEWLMPNDFEARMGHRFTFQTDWNIVCGRTLIECEVLELEPHRRLAWAWNWMSRNGARAPTRVAWTLAPEGAGTRLSLEHQGVEQLSFVMRWLQAWGWGGMLDESLLTVLSHVRDGRFTPGAIPLNKRFYKARTVPAHLVR